MHIQIINFHLKGMSPSEYGQLCDQLAPTFAELPGLVGKYWLADEDANTFGGVYLWEDRKAMESFTKTDLFRSVATHPKLADIASRDFSVMEAPTRVTRGQLEVTV